MTPEIEKSLADLGRFDDLDHVPTDLLRRAVTAAAAAGAFTPEEIEALPKQLEQIALATSWRGGEQMGR